MLRGYKEEVKPTGIRSIQTRIFINFESLKGMFHRLLISQKANALRAVGK